MSHSFKIKPDTVTDAPHLAAKACYDLRNKELEFPAQGTARNDVLSSYFSHDGHTHPENLHIMGGSYVNLEPTMPESKSDALFKYLFFPVYNSALTKKKKTHTAVTPFFFFTKKANPYEVMGSEEDPTTKGARESRFTSFQGVANEVTKVDPSLLTQHDIESIIDEDSYHIAGILNADVLDGIPYNVTSIVKGSIQVALVTSNKENKRPYLIFSVNSGTVEMKAYEFFKYLNVCGCACSGNFSIDYLMKTNIQGQFFVLDADDIIDFSASQDDSRSFHANTGNGVLDLPCVCYCCKPVSCFNFCCCCGVCKLCGCSCDKCCQCSTTYSDEYYASENHVVGAELPMDRETAFLSNQVLWKTKTTGVHEIKLSLTYTDKVKKGTSYKINLKLSHGETFKNAKKFLNSLQSFKKPSEKNTSDGKWFN